MCLFFFPVLKDEFRESPQDQSAAVGETVTFHCRPPKGEPEPSVLWMKGGDQIQKGGSNNRFQIQVNGDLVITSTRKRDAGVYKCIASNKDGERVSVPATLDVLGKKFKELSPFLERLLKKKILDMYFAGG